MAIIDAKLVFCTDLAFSDGSAGDIDSTNIIDLGLPNAKKGVATAVDIGAGTPIYVNGFITTAVTSGGTSIQAKLVHCATVGGTYVDLVAGEVILTGSASAVNAVGVDMMGGVALPPNHMQFLMVRFTAVGSVTSAGKASAFLSLGNFGRTAYA